MHVRSLAVIVSAALAVSGCSATIDLDAVAATQDRPSEADDATQRGTDEDVLTPKPALSVSETPVAAPTPADGVGDATPVPLATFTHTPAPTADPAATATPRPPPTATPVPPTPTPAPTATPLPTPTPTPVIIEFVIGPNAALLGVALGTPIDDAMAVFEAAIGRADFDSGWYEGCPLDGEDLNERLAQWGDLNVYFDRFEGIEQFRAWGYDLRIVDGGFPEIDLIQLPGGARMGDPVNEVAAAAGLEVVYDEVFDINRVGEPGYEIVSDAPPGAPVWGAFVPAIPTCE